MQPEIDLTGMVSFYGADSQAVKVDLLGVNDEMLASSDVKDGRFSLRFQRSATDGAPALSDYPKLIDLSGLAKTRADVIRAEHALDAAERLGHKGTEIAHDRKRLEAARHLAAKQESVLAGFIATSPALAALMEGREPPDETPAVRLRIQRDSGSPLESGLFETVPLHLLSDVSSSNLGSVPNKYAVPEGSDLQYGWAYPAEPPGVQRAGLPRAQVLQQLLSSPHISDPFLTNGQNHPEKEYIKVVVGQQIARLPLVVKAMDDVQRQSLGDFLSGVEDTGPTTVGDMQKTFFDIWTAAYYPHVDPVPGKRREDIPRPRDDAYFISRVLNGIYPCFFQKVPGTDGMELFVELNWDAYDFSSEDAKHDAPYELPNIRATFTRDSTGPDATLSPKSITIQYRKAGSFAKGEQTFDPPITATPADGAGDYSRWGHAKRLFRQSLLLAGEIDAHIARGHIVSEQYQMAMRRKLSKDNPLRKMLEPHLENAININNYGNPVIFEKDGIVARASALTGDAVLARIADQLAGLDWKGWSPRKPVAANHDFARAAQLYWSVVREYVDGNLPASADITEAQWAAIDSFSEDLTDHSPDFKPYLGVSSDAWLDRSEIAPDGSESGRTLNPTSGQFKSVHRIRFDADGDPGHVETRKDMVQLASYIIYHASFFHGYCNDQQIWDGGEIRYACFGLKSREFPAHGEVLDGADLVPNLEDAALQLFIAEALSKTQWGYVLGAGADLRHQKLGEILQSHAGDFPADIPATSIRSKINI